MDVAAQANPGHPAQPVVGKALPVFGMVAFYDFQWSDCLRSAIGYSRLDVDNSDGQLPPPSRAASTPSPTCSSIR